MQSTLPKPQHYSLSAVWQPFSALDFIVAAAACGVNTFSLQMSNSSMKKDCKCLNKTLLSSFGVTNRIEKKPSVKHR